MLTLKQTPHKTTSKFVNSALDTFEYYGFESATNTPKPKQRLSRARDLSYVLPHEKSLLDITKTCLENNAHLSKAPKLIYKINKPKKDDTSSSIALHVMGSQSTAAEILILSTINTLLRKLQIQNAVVHINSIGDKDSKSKFLRELNSYMRNVSSDLPPYAKRDLERKSPLLALVHLSEKNHPLIRTAPSPMEHLNDESRMRLRKILEYMENADMDYELNPTLVGSTDVWSHTIFEVRVPQDEGYITIIRGGRHNDIARRGFNRTLASVSAIIEHELHGEYTEKPRKQKTPKFFISYLGELARIETFKLIEQLHDQNIQVGKTIAYHHIGDQIKDSDKYNPPYLLIIGHKEAVEKTVIVRNTTTRSQKVIPVSKVVSYISRLKV